MLVQAFFPENIFPVTLHTTMLRSIDEFGDHLEVRQVVSRRHKK